MSYWMDKILELAKMDRCSHSFPNQSNCAMCGMTYKHYLQKSKKGLPKKPGLIYNKQR